jgi:Family of unknown function (DUF6680)
MNADTNLMMGLGMILAAFGGPIAAVLITLAWERSRRKREQKETILQTLLATRGRHADPGYSWAIRTIPMHFSRNAAVMKAHSEYMDIVRLGPTPENEEKQNIEAARRQGLLISEILQALDYKGLTAEQIEVYTARGLADREYLLEQALQALPHIAFSAKRSADYAEEMKIKIVGNEVALGELTNNSDLQ